MGKIEKDCVFCKIIKGEIKSEFLKESKNFAAIKDINPVAPGHALILSKEHYSTLLDVPNKLGNEMLEFAKSISSELLEKKLGDGFNIIMNNFSSAGQLVEHAHAHVIPRKKGDGIRFFVRK